MECELRFYKEKCIGCLACHTACINAHYESDACTESFRTVETVVDEEHAFQKQVSPGCTHCGACLHVCPVNAIYKDSGTGFILIDPEQCIGCKKCGEVCPLHVIRYDRNKKALKCDGCIKLLKAGKEPACVRNCAVHAIEWKEKE